LADTAKRDSQEMRYLLGSLSEDERNRLEENFFADDAKFEELEVLEDELIDDYVAGELSPDERRQFESKLKQSPRLVERVHFARALADKVDSLSSQPEPRSDVLTSKPIPPPKLRWWEIFTAGQPAFRIALAACLLLLLLGGAALLTGWLRTRRESERINAERAASQRQQEAFDRQLSEQQARDQQQAGERQRESEQRNQELKLKEESLRAAQSKEPKTSSPPVFPALSISPGLVRSDGSEPPTLKIPPGVNTARLQLDLENNDYPAYEATIKSGDGATVFRKRLKAHVTPQGPQVFLFVPSQLLKANGDFTIHVEGVTTSGQLENFNDYQFRVRIIK